jgi:hypothetical protein
MNDEVRQLAADSGALRRVTGRAFESGYEVLDLAFERGTLRLGCNQDTDEITVAALAQPSEFDPVSHQALADLIGKVIEHAWTMVNDRGYQDAFQLRCIDLAARTQACSQFEVAASAITVARVNI